MHPSRPFARLRPTRHRPRVPPKPQDPPQPTVVRNCPGSPAATHGGLARQPRPSGPRKIYPPEQPDADHRSRPLDLPGRFANTSRMHRPPDIARRINPPPPADTPPTRPPTHKTPPCRSARPVRPTCMTDPPAGLPARGPEPRPARSKRAHREPDVPAGAARIPATARPNGWPLHVDPSSSSHLARPAHASFTNAPPTRLRPPELPTTSTQSSGDYGN